MTAVRTPHPEVVFLYDATGHSPCHAVVKRTVGPWSAERVAFCGWQPPVGPTGFLRTPQGGLCHRCAPYVVEKDGVYRASTMHADPIADRLAERIYGVVLARAARLPILHVTAAWEALTPSEADLWRAIAGVAIDNHPLSSPASRAGGYEDDD